MAEAAAKVAEAAAVAAARKAEEERAADERDRAEMWLWPIGIVSVLLATVPVTMIVFTAATGIERGPGPVAPSLWILLAAAAAASLALAGDIGVWRTHMFFNAVVVMSWFALLGVDIRLLQDNGWLYARHLPWLVGLHVLWLTIGVVATWRVAEDEHGEKFTRAVAFGPLGFVPVAFLIAGLVSGGDLGRSVALWCGACLASAIAAAVIVGWDHELWGGAAALLVGAEVLAEAGIVCRGYPVITAHGRDWTVVALVGALVWLLAGARAAFGLSGAGSWCIIFMLFTVGASAAGGSYFASFIHGVAGATKAADSRLIVIGGAAVLAVIPALIARSARWSAWLAYIVTVAACVAVVLLAPGSHLGGLVASLPRLDGSVGVSG